MHSPHLSTVVDVSLACGVDLKTVHNWVNAGRIPPRVWFRTPSRRLRFHSDYLSEWLAEAGYLVPTSILESAACAAALRTEQTEVAARAAKGAAA